MNYTTAVAKMLTIDGEMFKVGIIADRKYKTIWEITKRFKIINYEKFKRTNKRFLQIRR